eukprot:COSAG01_NODE_1556_length_9940_cov_13.610337_2_plen_281_part_00
MCGDLTAQSTAPTVMRLEVALKVFGLRSKSDVVESDLKKMYHREALKCHPDKHPDDPTATVRFQQLSEAYGILIGEAEASVSEDEWSDDDRPTRNAGRQRSQRKKRTQQKEKKVPKTRKPRPGRKRKGEMSTNSAKELYERMFGRDFMIVEKPGGGHVLLSFGGGGGSARAKAEAERAATVRQRAAAAAFTPRSSSGFVESGHDLKDAAAATGLGREGRRNAAAQQHAANGAAGDERLHRVVRTILRHDPTVGLKKLTKIVQVRLTTCHVDSTRPELGNH